MESESPGVQSPQVPNLDVINGQHQSSRLREGFTPDPTKNENP